jgi:excinuclease UvrABC nuclease subunit
MTNAGGEESQVSNKPMNYRQAVKIATLSMQREMQVLAVQANLYERYDTPSCKSAWERREKLRQAIQVLNEVKHDQ